MKHRYNRKRTFVSARRNQSTFDAQRPQYSDSIVATINLSNDIITVLRQQ